ncbi:MAG TPA: hypothetical protein VJ397_01105 [Thermoplasmata archaeon]|nr:hypothetical protein [Thermoplasmata archaeon]
MFVERLRSFPIVLEVVPPHRRVTERALTLFVDRVRSAVRSVPHLDALNLPEILDENHLGKPFYRNMDPRRCSQILSLGHPVETIVNKVVVHLKEEEALERWLAESMGDYHLSNFVLVGGNSGRFDYGGPSVTEANRMLQKAAGARRDVACGNITIFERPSEVARLLEKTRAGAQFFTSQVIFEPEPATTVLLEYGEACAAEGLGPATVLLSFAPVADYEDVEFLAWLGANITAETEDRLLVNGETGAASLEVARRTWAQVRDAVARSRVPLGVNVEEISHHNFDLAVKMAAEVPAWKSA